jgi:hypothetical protein
MDPRDLDRRRAAPCGTTRATIGTPSVVSRPIGLPRPPVLRAPFVVERAATPRTVLTPGPPPRASARRAEYPWASAAPPIRLAAPRASATRDASDRLLPSHVFVPAPAPRRFPMRPALSRRRDRGDRLPHVSAIRFGGPHVLQWIHHGGLVVPVVVRASRTSDAPVAAPSRAIPLARGEHSMEPPRPPAARPRERRGPSRRSGTPSI